MSQRHRLTSLLLATTFAALSFGLAADRNDPDTWTWNDPRDLGIPGLQHETIESDSMRRTVGYQIYLPPQYALEPGRKFPVVYFLHGAGGTESSDAGLAARVRSLIVDEEIAPVIYVFPNGGARSGYRDSSENYVRSETMLMRELLPHIDGKFRTIDNAVGRGICGFSMGGGGAMRLGLKYSDTFGSIASLAAGLDKTPDAADGDNVYQHAEKLSAEDKSNRRLYFVIGDEDFLYPRQGPFLKHLDELGIRYTSVVHTGVSHNLGILSRLSAGAMIRDLDRQQKLQLAALGDDAALLTHSFEIPATDAGLPGAGPIRRYEWFQKLWLRKRTVWATQIGRDQGAVVFLGDSITQGWGDDMGGNFPGMKVANRGISGDTTRGVLIRLTEDVLSLNPRAVVLLIGTNDLEEGADPEVISANVELILTKLKEHNAAMPVLVCKVFPSSTTKKRSSADIKKINSLYKTITSHDANILLLETWLPFANDQGDATLGEFPDLLHPNKTGYAKWAAMLRPVLEDLNLLPVDADNFTSESGFEKLFNGRDFTGWEYRPSTAQDLKSATNWQRNNDSAPPWPILTRGAEFDGMTESSDNRYVARNGRLVVTIPPEGRRIQQIYTQRNFTNDFVLKLEFRATANADSGVFLRGRQLQCRDYLIAGPYKDLKNYRSLDWNEMIVTVKGNSARCTVNDEVIEEAFQIPDGGPIGLEGDRGQVEYRRIRLKEDRR